MEDFFPQSWIAQAGTIKNEKNEYSVNFIKWAEATKYLTDEQWVRGFNFLKTTIEKNVHDFKKTFPPSVIEFLAYTKPPSGTAAHKDFAPRTIPDESAKARSRKLGEETLGRLKDLFD